MAVYIRLKLQLVMLHSYNYTVINATKYTQ